MRPGQDGSDGRFIRFKTPEQGVQAAVEVLHVYRDKYGINTLEGIVNRWAPPSENNTRNYIAHMERRVGVSAGTALDLNDPNMVARIIQAKGEMEGGTAQMQRTFTPQVIARGVAAAFEQPSSIDGKRHVATRPGTVPAQVAAAGATPATAGAATTTPAASPATGGGQTRPAGQPEGMGQGQDGDVVMQIVMTLLAMIFGGGSGMAAQNAQPAQTGGMTPPNTPAAPANAAVARA